jgi:hypothetical protein
MSGGTACRTRRDLDRESALRPCGPELWPRTRSSRRGPSPSARGTPARRGCNSAASADGQATSPWVAPEATSPLQVPLSHAQSRDRDAPATWGCRRRFIRCSGGGRQAHESVARTRARASPARRCVRPGELIECAPPGLGVPWGPRRRVDDRVRGASPRPPAGGGARDAVREPDGRSLDRGRRAHAARPGQKDTGALGIHRRALVGVPERPRRAHRASRRATSRTSSRAASPPPATRAPASRAWRCSMPAGRGTPRRASR